MLDIPCDEEASPAVASGGIRNGGTAGLALDFCGTDSGALTFDRGVLRYSRGVSSGKAGPRKTSFVSHRRA